MATKKPQILLTLDDDLIKGIDDYHSKNHLFSKSEAVRQLLRAGINATKPKVKKK
jgi:metal-responsive CopG/Arc/MetJ family transcriptional regulator